jgi:galactose mutarotase-like enzyme
MPHPCCPLNFAAVTFRQLHVSGLPALALSNDELECIVVPSLGGKITNLRRKRGREWLWRDPAREISDLPADGSFPDTGGWDECFPTIGACPMPGAKPEEPPLPDHGELWGLDWHHDVLESPAGTLLTSRVEGRALPYEFQRDILVPPTGDAIRLEYRLVHRGEAAFPYLWAAHPVFGAPAGTRVTLPTVNEMRVDHASDRPDLPADAMIPWPLDGQSHSWEVPAITGWSAKLYAPIGASGTVLITDPRRGEQLVIGVDPGMVPLVGLFIDLRTEHGRIAVEPCLGAPDRLDRAVREWRSAPVLGLGERRHWTVTLRLPAFD